MPSRSRMIAAVETTCSTNSALVKVENLAWFQPWFSIWWPAITAWFSSSTLAGFSRCSPSTKKVAGAAWVLSVSSTVAKWLDGPSSKVNAAKPGCLHSKASGTRRPSRGWGSEALPVVLNATTKINISQLGGILTFIRAFRFRTLLALWLCCVGSVGRILMPPSPGVGRGGSVGGGCHRPKPRAGSLSVPGAGEWGGEASPAC